MAWGMVYCICRKEKVGKVRLLSVCPRYVQVVKIVVCGGQALMGSSRIKQGLQGNSTNGTNAGNVLLEVTRQVITSSRTCSHEVHKL